MKIRLCVMFFIFAFSAILGKIEVKKMIIPTPQKIELTNNLFVLEDDLTIGILDNSLNFQAQQIQTHLQNRFGINSAIVQDGIINLRLVDEISNLQINKQLLNQAYTLIITENTIEINALTPRGLFYGTMSLIQLLDNTATRELPTLKIEDWPDMEIRGISDDISRGQVSNQKNFKRIIDFIARYKMNVYMPYLEDMIQLKSYPSIGKGRGALSPKEISEIVKYATERFIDVIPAFQTLGHFENILTSEEFVDYAEFPGAASLAVTEQKTYTFLEEMLKEVFELFPSEYINIGADESYDVGSGKSKELTKKIGRAKVHAEHYKKVFNFCKENNKKILMYGDVILNHQEILEQIPNDITIVDWHYGAKTRYVSTDIFREAGFNFLVSPSVWNFRTSFPTYQIALPNIKTIISDGLLNGANGMINSNWGDYGAETFKEFVLLGYAWSAQCSWNLKESNLSQFNDTFFADFWGIKDSHLNSLYIIFSNVLNEIQWHEVWRHPALELPSSAWWAPRLNKEEISSWMNWTLPEAYKTIEDFENLVTKNKDHFQLLRFIIHLDFWYIKKLEANYYLRSAIEIKNLEEKISNSTKNNEDDKNQLISLKRRLKSVNVEKILDDNIKELKKLKSEYQRLWLNYYKKDNLNMIVDKFDRLIQYFEESKIAISDNSLDNPTIESKWIYASKRRSSAYSKAEFKREFSIRNKVEKAQIQLLADTHAKLYINNKFVDEIYSKRSLSLLTEYDRILFIDAKKYFKKGANKIRVVAKSYKGSKGAGINFIARISTKNGTFKILSDEKWKGRGIEPKRTWKKVITKDYGYEIIAPNFDTNRSSWIER